MVRIGLLSDTHGYIDKGVFKHFETCDEIWHAGDIGSMEAARQLAEFKPLKAVHGNIDGLDIRNMYPENQIFECEEVDVFITHIGTPLPKTFGKQATKLFICGHSHILKVKFDKKLNFLRMNPGAAGNFGSHKVKTLLRFTIDGKEIKDLEVIELKKSA